MVRKEQLYVMCNLEKKNGTEALIQTAWIPEQFAVKDKYLKINDDNGWRVVDGKHPLDTPRPLGYLNHNRRAAGQLV